MQANIEIRVVANKSVLSLMYFVTTPRINLDPIEPTALREIISPMIAGSIALSFPSKGKKITNKSKVEEIANDINTANEISFRESMDFAADQVLLCSSAAFTVGDSFRHFQVGKSANEESRIAKIKALLLFLGIPFASDPASKPAITGPKV